MRRKTASDQSLHIEQGIKCSVTNLRLSLQTCIEGIAKIPEDSHARLQNSRVSGQHIADLGPKSMAYYQNISQKAMIHHSIEIHISTCSKDGRVQNEGQLTCKAFNTGSKTSRSPTVDVEGFIHNYEQ